MIGIFTDKNQTIIVGLDEDGNPIDEIGVLSGPHPKIDLDKFDKVCFDPTGGQVLTVSTKIITTATHPIVRRIVG